MKKGVFKRQRERDLRHEHLLKRASVMHDPEERIDLRKVSGDLGLRTKEVEPLLPKLEKTGHLKSSEGSWQLTQAGWELGRNLLRAHRIYESYLAEETGLGPADWHAEADRAEHELDRKTVDKIALGLNRPRYDPHGDAIPTKGLDMREQTGILLSRVEEDGVFKIRHIEDEPREPFESLIKIGMAPGLILEVNLIPGGRFIIRWAGQETILDSAQAAALLVSEYDRENMAALPHGLLSETDTGDTATIHSLSPAIRGLERRRLLDLGFVPGSKVVREGNGPIGGPARFRVRGTVQALRSEQARKIFINEEKS